MRDETTARRERSDPSTNGILIVRRNRQLKLSTKYNVSTGIRGNGTLRVEGVDNKIIKGKGRRGRRGMNV